MSSVKKISITHTSSKKLITWETPAGVSTLSKEVDYTPTLGDEGMSLQKIPRLFFLTHTSDIDASQLARQSGTRRPSTLTSGSDASSSRGSVNHSRKHFSDWDVVSEDVKSDEEYHGRVEDAKSDNASKSIKSSKKGRASGKKKARKNNKALKFMKHVAAHM